MKQKEGIECSLCHGSGSKRYHYIYVLNENPIGDLMATCEQTEPHYYFCDNCFCDFALWIKEQRDKKFSG